MDLRRAVVNHLRHDESASQFVTEPWALYLKKMEQSGTFGDHVTLRAVARLYEVQIVVLSSLKTASLISGAADTSFDPTVTTLFVGHFAEGQGEHYFSMEHPINVTEFCSTNLMPPVSVGSDSSETADINLPHVQVQANPANEY